MDPFEDVCAHVFKARIGSVFKYTNCYGKIYRVRIRLGNGLIKENVDHIRKLIDMIDALPTDGSAPEIMITYYCNHHFSPSGWAGVQRGDNGEWAFLFMVEEGSDFDLVNDYVHNIKQKRTTLFWELLTRVDRTA